MIRRSLLASLLFLIACAPESAPAQTPSAPPPVGLQEAVFAGPRVDITDKVIKSMNAGSGK